jgi:hypothetical protein
MRKASRCAGSGARNIKIRRDMRSVGAVAAQTSPTAMGPTRRSDSTAPRRRVARHVANKLELLPDQPCPSRTSRAFARLLGFATPMDRFGRIMQPESRLTRNYERSIGLIEDPVEDCSGPLWVRGGVTVIATDGFHYEVRNRVTLCRRGASRNKPFCEGSGGGL